jgi:uncharacterized protein (DUF58 family)
MVVRRIAWFFFILADYVALLYYGRPVFFYVLVFLISIFLLSVLELVASVFSFRLKSDPNLFFSEKNEPVDWRITASTIRFPAAHVKITVNIPLLSTEPSPDNKFYVSVSSKKPCVHIIQIVPQFCGRFPLKVTSVEFFDLFGFFRIRVSPEKLLLENPCYITVLPGILRVSRATRTYSELIPPMRKTFERAETVGIHPYREGDDFRSIHWKFTARTGTLHIKEYEKGVRDLHLIYLDLTAPLVSDIDQLSVTDRMLCEAANLCAYLLRDQRPVMILCYSSQKDEQHTVAHYGGLGGAREFFASRSFVPIVPDEYKDRLSSFWEIGRNSLSVFSATVSPDSLSFLSRFSGNLSTVTLFVVSQTGHEEKGLAVAEYYSDLGVKSLLIHPDDESVRRAAL